MNKPLVIASIASFALALAIFWRVLNYVLNHPGPIQVIIGTLAWMPFFYLGWWMMYRNGIIPEVTRI